MRYEIKGTPFPVVTCYLEKGEVMITEKGGMSWMTDKMKMETNTGGGLAKGLGRMFSGESIFLNEYTAEDENQSITFASSYPGRILDIKLENGKTIIAQKDALLAMEKTVQMDIHLKKKIGVGFFGGEGFVMQKFSGDGYVFMEIDGEVIEYELKAGERMFIDQGHLAAMEDTVTYDITTVQGAKNILFGGEGLFLGTLTGPGKIWIQTMPISNLVNIIHSKSMLGRK
ncbi:MAG: TIGR00266 family protein [Methanimicrococcus sp.]|nr:TIGR00266 family protein [Methanimicrococcus sp.]